jgi:hypothetical protein
MSTLISKNVQVGTSGTATNNFTLYQPASPDGTVRLGVGNTGATTLDAVTVSNAGNVSVPSLTVNSNNISAVNSLGFRNRIIDGDMRIDQRNAGASITPTTSGDWWGCDRWRYNVDQSSKFSTQQSSVAPAGFTNSTLITSLSAYSVISSDVFTVGQIIEGFNVSDLGWGAAGAQAVTLSFWVRSSLTGTFGGAINNSGFTRSYPFTFTINAANTYEYKTITIAGDTTGTWLTTNGAGIRVYFSLGMGSTRSGTAGAWAAGDFRSATGATSVVGTNGATFYITGVQLEAGTVASPFERRDYGRELIMCQRYFETYALNNVFLIGISQSLSTASTVLPWKVTKRAAPTITLPSAGQTSGTITFLTGNGGYPSATGTHAAADITVDKATINGTGYSGLTSMGPSYFWSTGTSTIFISSEL